MRARLCALLVLVAAGGCSTVEWRRAQGYHPVVPLVFSSHDLVGQGIIRTPDGFVTRACLEKVETVTAGGRPQTALYLADDRRLPKEARLQQFVEESRAQVEALATGRALPPVSLLVTVTVPGQWTDIVESSADFRPFVAKLIREKNEEEFFRQCGTEVVTSAAYDSAAYLFLAYLPRSADEAATIRQHVTERLARREKDTLQLGLLDDMPAGVLTYYSVRADTAEIAAPSPFTLERVGSQKVEELVTQMIEATYNSGRGRLRTFETRPWRTFSDGRLLIPRRDQDPRPQEQQEFVTARLEILEREVQRYWLRLWQSEYLVRRQGPEEATTCMDALVPLRRDLGPEQVEACETEARARLIAAVELLPKCERLMRAITITAGTGACRTVGALGENVDAPLMQDATYLPVELTLEAEDRWAQNRDGMDAPFAIAWERGQPTERVALGALMDPSGRKYSGDCMKQAEASEGDHQAEMAQAQEQMKSAGVEPTEEPAPETFSWSQADWDDLAAEPETAEELEDQAENPAGEEEPAPSATEPEGEPKVQEVLQEAVKKVLPGVPSPSELAGAPGETGEGGEPGGPAEGATAPGATDAGAETTAGGDAASFDVQRDENGMPLMPVSPDGRPAPTGAPPLTQGTFAPGAGAPAPGGEEGQITTGGATPAERVFRLTSAYEPHSRRGWPRWKRWLYFWKDPPADRQIFHGLFEIAGISKKLAADFELTDAAKELVKKDLEEFYRVCGTHYVSQIEHRRGFVYFFTLDSPGDREISVLPFGLSRTTAGSPLFRPRTVAKFFESRDQLVAVFDDDTQALAVRLQLAPWINYLRTHNLITR